MTRYYTDDPALKEEWLVIWNAGSTQIQSIENVPAISDSIQRTEISYDHNGNPILLTVREDGELVRTAKLVYSRSEQPVVNIALTLMSESTLLSEL